MDFIPFSVLAEIFEDNFDGVICSSVSEWAQNDHISVSSKETISEEAVNSLITEAGYQVKLSLKVNLESVYEFYRLREGVMHNNELKESNLVACAVKKILLGESVRQVVDQVKRLYEDDQEYWDYVHTYDYGIPGHEEEVEKAADFFDVSPDAFAETYVDFFELDETSAHVDGFLKESKSLTETRTFKVGEKFVFKDKYGSKHECTVLKKDLFDDMDYEDYAIGTMTYSYPTLGEPHKETVRIYKSEQSDSYGDEYFVSDVTKANNGLGIASWVFPNR